VTDEDQETIVHEEDEKSAGEKAKESAEAREKGAEKVREMEEQDDVPTDLDEWPSDEGKYITFGGPEGEAGYDEGATKKLGESEVRHHEDGNVTVSGEEVDDPDDYKGEPIPGGPTDPNSPDVAGENKDSSSADDDED
jgi:hypothetical protein